MDTFIEIDQLSRKYVCSLVKYFLSVSDGGVVGCTKYQANKKLRNGSQPGFA